MNRLTLAAAGSRKTQSIIDECRDLDAEARILVLTYTTTNQTELERRLRADGGVRAQVEVVGWFSFLINHLTRPYLPVLFDNRRITGFSFDGDPSRFAKGEPRYLDDEGRVYRCHLPQLSYLVGKASPAVLDRLSRIYSRIYIDEVQDLCGYDLEILLLLMKSSIDLVLVGDIRQALLATNPREAKNKKFMYSEIRHWFEAQRKKGRVRIDHRNDSWRCNQLICDFADSIFDSTWGLPATSSKNMELTGHDGVYVVDPADVVQYVEMFRPLCLRYNKSFGTDVDLEYMNYGESKGLTVDRVLIQCTKNIEKFVHSRVMMSGRSACGFYVAATRARSSVALVLPANKAGALPVWKAAS
jgi:DNA helicase-2/ATP-dependent DNA helicase PcrA